MIYRVTYPDGYVQDFDPDWTEEERDREIEFMSRESGGEPVKRELIMTPNVAKVGLKAQQP